MTTRSASAALSNSKGPRALSLSLKGTLCAGLLALGFAAAGLHAQSPTAAPESSAARNLLAPAPALNTGPTVTTNSVTAPSGYVLSANDQIAVEVFGEDELRTNGRLNAEGNLSLPLLGSVHFAGLTLTQATSRVTELYA